MRQLTDEDFADVRAIVRRLRTYDPDEAYANGCLGLVIAARGYDPARGPWGPHRAVVVRRCIIDANRSMYGRHEGASEASRVYATTDEEAHRCRPRHGQLGDWDRAVPPPDDDVVNRITVRAALDGLRPKDRQVALASVVPGGQSALAREWGVTEGAITLRRRDVYSKLRSALAVA